MIDNPEQPTTKPDHPASLDGVQFAAHFAKAHPYLWQIALGMSGNRTAADDLVQESAMIAWSKIDSFDPGTNFSAWMAAIVRRCALNLVRKQNFRATRASDPAVIDSHTFITQGKSAPVQVVSDDGELREMQTEFDDDLLQGLATLSATARCCLLLRVVNQLSYGEISQLMNLSQGTAMSHVHRSKAALRSFFERLHSQKE